MSINNTFILPHPPIIVPEVGRGEEEKARKTIEGYEKVAKLIGEIKPDRIIISSPHAPIYADYINISSGVGSSGSFSNFSAPEVDMDVEYDERLVKLISDMAREKGISAGTLGRQGDELDHGVLIPLYYINKYHRDYKIVRTGVSGLPLIDHYEFGKVIQRACEEVEEKVVFIASGDLSHKLLPEGPYGYVEEGPIFDKKIGEIIESRDFSQFFKFDSKFLEAAAECGLRSFVIMAGVLDKKSVESELFSLEGPYGVGYATACFKVTGEDSRRCFGESYLKEEREKIKNTREKADAWTELARKSLETYIKKGSVLSLPEELPEELTSTRAGAFVTLYKRGELRGCIGTIEPTVPTLGEEIIQNAISAGVKDPRFPPVSESELEDLVYSVDVLSPSEPISSLEELDISRYGVIVTGEGKRGLLLPNIEGIDSVEQQVEIAKKKAGIRGKNYRLERFEVVRHK
ncbi:AmmeMemoRadiSam system protein A [Anaerosphaera multitolerans]|uniref:AmmeMemoRadiSam system protein A n=1 Tax=Anaerosphaera multitolerans TaxID=2487351 RepID=A0A437S7G1_9FIRM|nr:AmmeMemoRadiSam system protein A [Anaerosphaera multitolerans]RVU55010.1 AmmeMemoRadiSam system protein A [Anaerosphaera multitolerans]